MKGLALDLSDKEIFHTIFDPDCYNLFQKHTDALAQLFTDQGPTFWLRYLISLRDYCIKDLIVKFTINQDTNGQHEFTDLGDEIYIVIYKELLIRPTAAKIRTFSKDLYIIGDHKRLSLNGSIVNNPFYHSETRDSFRRLLGFTLELPETKVKGIYLFGLAAPGLMRFAGGLGVFFRRWLRTKISDSVLNAEINNKWQPPNEWLKKSYYPNKFEWFLAETFKSNLNETLNISKKFTMNNYEVILQSIKDGVVPNFCGEFKKCGCQAKCTCSSKIEDDVKPLTTGELKKFMLDSLLIDDSTDPAAEYEFEELRRKQLWEMATQEFKKENAEGSDNSKFDNDQAATPKKRKRRTRRHRGRNKEKPEPPVPINSTEKTDKTDKINEDLNACITSMNTLSTKEAAGNTKIADSQELDKICTHLKHIQHCIAENSNSEINDKEGASKLEKIHDNLNRIEQYIHETGKLDADHFSLMLQTGKLLTDNSKPKAAQNSVKKDVPKVVDNRKCAGCFKEGKDIKLKKCARCKSEGIANPRYYCSRNCQVDDWTECHRNEHENGKLAKVKA